MLDCKFMKHGLTISNDGIVRPCCVWKADKEWEENNHYTKISSIRNWHNSEQVLEKRRMLENGIWPDNCVKCKHIEEAGRQDSMRGNGNSSYYDYNDEDIFLEIRPGVVCNFACQTCDASSSTRIRDFMHRAGLINKKDIDITAIKDFNFLNPISHKIKDIAILGGEPFYDKHCLKFLEWMRNNVDANLIIFTNGLFINYEFLEKYKSKIILVFSIDAVGKPADYIRYGSDWKKVKENYFKVRQYDNIEVRVNVTTSVYNFCYVEEVLDFFRDDWPDLVTFGYAHEPHLQPNVIPLEKRPKIIESLERIPNKIWKSDIHKDQQHNTINTIVSIIDKLKNNDFDLKQYTYLCSYIEKMDKVKKINIQDYCPELYEVLFQDNSNFIN